MPPLERTNDRVEKAYLLPVALSKSQFGAWWTAALDEGLLNFGNCMGPAEIWVDPAQMRREPQPFNAWRPRGNLQPFQVPPTGENHGAWAMEPGSILGFRQIDGLILQLDSRGEGESLHFLAFDARFFDEQLEWKSRDSRDRLLHLISRALVGHAPAAPRATEPKPAQVQAAIAVQQRLR